MKRNQAKKHKTGTYEIDKISLSCFDDKSMYQMAEFIRLLIFIKIVIKNAIRTSIIYEGIRRVFILFYEEILHAKKSIKCKQGK